MHCARISGPYEALTAELDPMLTTSSEGGLLCDDLPKRGLILSLITGLTLRRHVVRRLAHLAGARLMIELRPKTGIPTTSALSKLWRL